MDNDAIVHILQFGFRHRFRHKAVFARLDTVHCFQTHFVMLANERVDGFPHLLVVPDDSDSHFSLLFVGNSTAPERPVHIHSVLFYALRILTRLSLTDATLAYFGNLVRSGNVLPGERLGKGQIRGRDDRYQERTLPENGLHQPSSNKQRI